MVNRNRLPDAIRPVPANSISNEDKLRILQVSTDPEYDDRPPPPHRSHTGGRGISIASESSFYRVLKAKKLVRHRGRARYMVFMPDLRAIQQLNMGYHSSVVAG